ncbi:MAG TPA: haloacid dehalogenase type II [Streptosporangiaceae bacterium]|nr:haloacid dehalogenase type II [Streptosporangiaceae bacterium]
MAFDMFGTLADTASVAGELAPACGDRAGDVAAAWRARQLEYMFRVTAMGLFPPFADLTRWSLAGALAESGFTLPESQVSHLAGAYRRLRPYADARPALTALREQGHAIVVFSVGPVAWLEELASSYLDLVEDLVSAEQAGVYKPHPGIYRHLLAVTQTEPASTLLVSSNPFDIIGAGAIGLRTAWCKRQSSALFDPWGTPPDHVFTGLADLAGLLLRGQAAEESRRP